MKNSKAIGGTIVIVVLILLFIGWIANLSEPS